jgi:hypothetical protein
MGTPNELSTVQGRRRPAGAPWPRVPSAPPLRRPEFALGFQIMGEREAKALQPCQKVLRERAYRRGWERPRQVTPVSAEGCLTLAGCAPTLNRRWDRGVALLPEATPTAAPSPFAPGLGKTGEDRWSPVQNMEEIAGPCPVADECLCGTGAFQTLPSIRPADQPSCRAESTENSFPGEGIRGQINDVVIEVMPGIIPGSDVHGLVVVQEMERKGQHAIGTLVIQVEWRSAAERREHRVSRKCARRQVQKSFREFKGFRPFVGIESQHEVGLYVGYVPPTRLTPPAYSP